MRLINTQTRAFEEFIGRDVPKYAILSHTWEAEEVSYADYVGGSYHSMKGYEKIEMTCQLAVKDGIGYAWVDTCCIDKRSSAELTEAINSMFRWYERAEVCYAFLSDLPSGAAVDTDRLTDCRWFTRGWTLQELIAPHKVAFFNQEWECIGFKSTLSNEIAYITQISHYALLNERPLSQVKISEKMTWASMRVTTRIEDTAYCLLGLFDVNMPLLYGEEEQAFQRLQEELIKRTPDLSIFGWKLPFPNMGYPPPTYCGVLAKSPSYFSGLHGECPSPRRPRRPRLPKDDFSTTHHGVVFNAALQKKLHVGKQSFCYVLGIISSDVHYASQGVLLRKVGDNRFLRSDPWRFHEFNTNVMHTATSFGTKYFLTRPPDPIVWDDYTPNASSPKWITEDDLPSVRGHTLRIKLPPDVCISGAWPKGNFDDEDQLWLIPHSDHVAEDWGMLQLSVTLHPFDKGDTRNPVNLDIVFLTADWSSRSYRDETWPIQCSVVPHAIHAQLFRDIQLQAEGRDFNSVHFQQVLNKHDIAVLSPAVVDIPHSLRAMVVSFTCKPEQTHTTLQRRWVVEFSVEIMWRDSIPAVVRVGPWRL